jgi:hypothetical protein
MGLTCIFLRGGGVISPSRPAGERHWKVRLSDSQVDDMRVKREDENWSLGRLAKHFNVPRATVQSIVNYRRR